MSKNYLWVDEEWTWFPDGDESRAMTRVYIGSTKRSLDDSTLWSLQILLSEVTQFIEAKEGGFDSAKIHVQSRSAFRDNVSFVYERPAYPEEVAAEKAKKKEAVAERVAELKAELKKLKEKA